MDSATLRDRLRGIVNPGGPSALPGPEAARGATSPPGADASDRVRPRASQLPLLNGSWREQGAGRSFVVRRAVDSSARHGVATVGALAERLAVAGSAATIVGAGLARPPFLFFDLETTGLSGGAGTYAFLVGCGWFEDGTFVTEQHLLTDHPGERGMLLAVAVAIRAAGTLVTFNGKSFDAPLLETRYQFHRLDPPCADLPHVDLLHPARRFWGGTVEAGCSLAALEARLLGVRRVGDVPGLEIPRRYFHFVRSGDPRPLASVLEHNRLDLLSLAALTAHLFRLVDAGPAAARDAREALALGRVYDRAALADRAQASFERALALSGESALSLEALRALAVGARRQRRHEAAAARWQAMLAVPDCPAILAREAIEALAVHHEHRHRDLDAAKTFALRGLEIEGGAAWGDATRHRLARIERKMVSAQRPLLSSSILPLVCDSPTSGPRTSS
jgi:uncharacterized protein YprB with RNaseH-like and TPR domain